MPSIVRRVEAFSNTLPLEAGRGRSGPGRPPSRPGRRRRRGRRRGRTRSRRGAGSTGAHGGAQPAAALERLEVGAPETELVEAEQAAERTRERPAGGALDDLAQQDVARVGVVELLPRRGSRLAVRHREAHLLRPRPVMAPVCQNLFDELRIARVVVQPARVHEQMADVDRVGVVAAAPEQVERRRCEMIGNRVVEAEAPLSTSRSTAAAVNVFVTLAIRKPARGSSVVDEPSLSCPVLFVECSPGETTASRTPGYVRCSWEKPAAACWSLALVGGAAEGASAAAIASVNRVAASVTARDRTAVLTSARTRTRVTRLPTRRVSDLCFIESSDAVGRSDTNRTDSRDRRTSPVFAGSLMRPGGFEPPTRGLEVRRSVP